MNARVARMIGLIVGLALVRAGPAAAMSLRSSAAEIDLGYLSLGESFDTRGSPSLSISYENTGSEASGLTFALSPPSRLKDGYDPWPFPDKVKITPDKTSIKPGGKAVATLAIEVPRDERLIDGQYQFDVVAKANAGAQSLILRARVTVEIGTPPVEVSGDADDADAVGEFMLSPPQGSLTAHGVDPGGKVEPAQTTFKIVNAGDKPLKLRMRKTKMRKRVRAGESNEEPMPNPAWIRADQGPIDVGPGKIKPVTISIVIPPERRYAGRRFVGVVSVEEDGNGKNRARRVFEVHARAQDVSPQERSERLSEP